MDKLIVAYCDRLKDEVSKQIDHELNQRSDDDLVMDCYTSRLGGKGFSTFQKFYYDALTENREDYFNEFRARYALQGVDGTYLNKLNMNKMAIIARIQKEEVIELYFEHFHQQSVKHGSVNRSKNLGSFYTKLCHTFNKEQYTPMDNPMRSHFGLQNESFPIAMLVVSGAFLNWCNNNRNRTEQLKSRLATEMSIQLRKTILPDQISDMKLMDMIYWAKANPQ